MLFNHCQTTAQVASSYSDELAALNLPSAQEEKAGNKKARHLTEAVNVRLFVQALSKGTHDLNSLTSQLRMDSELFNQMIRLLNLLTTVNLNCISDCATVCYGAPR